MKVFLIILLFNLISVAQAQEKSKKEIKQENQQLAFDQNKKLIDNLNFTFIPSQANPEGGRSINLATSNYFLKITDSIVESYLPFYGRAYNAGYGGSDDSGIKCNIVYYDYSASINEKKQSYTIKFSAKGNSDTFTFTLTVSGNQSALLVVSSMKKAAISYFGSIKPNEN